jgi:predicted branched-subunit amino acid permease
MKHFFLSLCFCLLAITAFAGDAGMVATNASGILENIIAIIMAILYIAAMAVFISATMKYRIHRQNPQQIPLSTPLTELVLAIVLAAIPTVTKITNGELFSSDTQQEMPQAPVYLAPVRPIVPAQPVQPYQPPR